jgi:hypothetical protein
VPSVKVTGIGNNITKINPNIRGYLTKNNDRKPEIVSESNKVSNKHALPLKETPAVNRRLSLDDGLVAYYPFTGSANDYSSNGNDPSYNSATLTSDKDGNANRAYYFSGSSYIKIPDSDSLTLTNTFSFSLWAYKESTSGYQYLLNKHVHNTNNDGSYWLIFSTSNGRFGGTDSSSSWSEVLTSSSIPQSTWTYLTFTYSNPTWSFYINGALDSSGSEEYGITDNSHDLYIGAEETTSGVGYYFPGKLDEIRIYNRELTSSEVSSLFNFTSSLSPVAATTEAPSQAPTHSPTIDPDSGLLAYYPFTGSADDFSGNGNNPSFNSASLTTDKDGNANRAYYFSGSNYIKIPDSDSLTFTDTFSFSLWAYAEYNSGYNYLLNKHIHNTNNDGSYWLILMNGARGKFGGTDSSSSWSEVLTSSSLEQDTWTHIAFTYNNPNWKFYIDGSLDSSGSESYGITDNSNDLYIGAEETTSGVGYSFPGKLDEIRIYDRELSSSEVNSLYTASSTDTSSPSSSNTLILVIALTVGISALIVCCCLFKLYCYKTQPVDDFQRPKRSHRQANNHNETEMVERNKRDKQIEALKKKTEDEMIDRALEKPAEFIGQQLENQAEDLVGDTIAGFIPFGGMFKSGVKKGIQMSREQNKENTQKK